MSFHARVLSRARREYDNCLTYIAARSKPGAVAWARAFDRMLTRIEADPEVFPLAVEDEFVEFDLREALFKTRRGLVYRALFTVVGDDVLILHVRGPGQDLLSSESITRPPE